MSQSSSESEHLLASLLGDEQPSHAADAAQQRAQAPQDQPDEDVESLIDALEGLIADGRRMPFRKLLVDEDRLLSLIDQLRTAIPAEVRQAHQLLDRHDEIIRSAQDKARQMIDERGVLEAIEKERARILDEADREAQRTRNEADRYVRNVLLDLDDRLGKLQNSVRNGLDALEGDERDT